MKNVNELIELVLENGKISACAKLGNSQYITKETIAEFLEVHKKDVEFEWTSLKIDRDGDLVLPDQINKEEMESWLTKLEKMLAETYARGNQAYKDNEAFVNKFNSPKKLENG